MPAELPATVQTDARAKFLAQQAEHAATLAKFRSDEARQASGLETLDARVATLRRNLVPAQAKVTRALPLYRDNLISRIEFEAREAEAREYENQITILKAQRTELLNQIVPSALATRRQSPLGEVSNVETASTGQGKTTKWASVSAPDSSR